MYTKEEKNTNMINLIKEIKEDELFKKDVMEIPFGSNSYALIQDDGTVMFNSFNYEQFFFNTVEDFVAWRINDDETVTFEYQVYLGNRNEIDESKFLDEYDIDPEEDGSDIWSIRVKTNEKNKDKVVFKKELKIMNFIDL